MIPTTQNQFLEQISKNSERLITRKQIDNMFAEQALERSVAQRQHWKETYGLTNR